MLETLDECLARVQSMAAGDPAWDLSPNDKHALTKTLMEIIHLREQLHSATRESACPCCKAGVNLAGDPCQECHGKGLAIVAYESLRFHYTLVSEQLRELREAISPHRIDRKPKYYIGVAARMRAQETVIKPKVAVFARPECVFNYCPNQERCQNTCEVPRSLCPTCNAPMEDGKLHTIPGDNENLCSHVKGM